MSRHSALCTILFTKELRNKIPQEPILNGEDILKIIPQRAPVVMVDTLYDVSDDSADTALTIAPDNIFCRDGVLTESGIIEHTAQSAALFSGYGYYLKGENPHLGFIGEIKHFDIFCLPRCGETLNTHLTVLASAMGITLVTVVVISESGEVAKGQMKIFIKE